jgi:hypothetical protein
MGLDSFGKLLGSIASTTAKKAGEQVQITKLSIDKAGLEKQIEGVYCAMGRYCHARARRGETLLEELLEYCRDVEALEKQIALLDEEIVQHKEKRDAAGYRITLDDEEADEPLYAEAVDIPGQDDGGDPSADAPPCGETAQEPPLTAEPPAEESAPADQPL